jgi:signal transduction histidine kinase
MTLRLRLALYTSGFLVLLCIELIAFINVATTLTHSRYLLAISLFGLIVNMLAGGLGAYWIAGRALQPVKAVSTAALYIGASTLNTRLNLDGPHDELRELGHAFDSMLERLEQAFEQQSRFVADAAHELRTPLAILRTNLEVIVADPQATLEEYQALMVVLERTLGRLEHLVAALLVLAMEEHAVALEDVALLPLLQEALTELRPMAEEKQVWMLLTADQPVSVYGDEHLLGLVFRNLIENALRYNHPGGKVTITVEDGTSAVQVRVADTGIGIPKEAQEHIFERFYRVEASRSRYTGGAGLGLALARHVLNLQKGSVQVECSSPQGSVFVVALLKRSCPPKTAPNDISAQP